MIWRKSDTFMLGNHLHPRGRIGLHQRVWYEDTMHSVQDRRQHGVPQAHFTLENKYSTKDLFKNLIKPCLSN